jgi:hypothetical protein
MAGILTEAIHPSAHHPEEFPKAGYHSFPYLRDDRRTAGYRSSAYRPGVFLRAGYRSFPNPQDEFPPG